MGEIAGAFLFLALTLSALAVMVGRVRAATFLRYLLSVAFGLAVLHALLAPVGRSGSWVAGVVWIVAGLWLMQRLFGWQVYESIRTTARLSYEALRRFAGLLHAAFRLVSRTLP